MSDTATDRDHARLAPILAGVVTALVGFTSSFVVVLTGLRAVGASPAQAESGLVVLCLLQGVAMIALARRHRIPIALAWSTPGAAVLASTGPVDGGWPAAVGAFVVVGVLIVLTGLITALGDLVAAIPVPLARAMLAGVLLPLCLAPVTALADSPGFVAPVVLTWLVMHRVSRRWAVPASLGVALAIIAVDAGGRLQAGDVLPSLTLTTPSWTPAALVSIALPLYVVTMASQNVPGVAIMRAFDYRLPWRESMGVTGVATMLGAPFGGHAVNLAAITAALGAGPTAGPDRDRRWLSSITAGSLYLVLAGAAGLLTALVAAAPDGVVQAAAGLALLGTLASALGESLADPSEREAAAVTLLVAASGVTVAGIGAAFWALVAGLVVRAVVRERVSSSAA